MCVWDPEYGIETFGRRIDWCVTQSKTDPNSDHTLNKKKEKQIHITNHGSSPIEINMPAMAIIFMQAKFKKKIIKNYYSIAFNNSPHLKL